MSVINAENPLGVLRIDHIEMTTDNPETIHQLYRSLGFVKVQQRSTDSVDQFYMKQNDMDVIVSVGKKAGEFAYDYQKAHGDGCCTLAFRVKDAEHALKTAIERGAEKRMNVTVHTVDGETIKLAAIKGFGDVRNVFVERSGDTERFLDGFELIPDPEPIPEENDPKLIRLDHLTNNVYRGDMEKWVSFYEQIYNWKQVRYFDIKGLKTGLYSKVVASPNREIIIPINEPDDSKGYSQIQEYLDEHKGEGVQHIAMTTNDIVRTVQTLKRNGFEFLDVNEVYYEMLPQRLPGIEQKEDLDAIAKESILVDGDEKSYLLQIFTSNQIGPLFYEIICRKGHDGFGEGNFQALFDSIERDQERRGVLK